MVRLNSDEVMQIRRLSSGQGFICSVHMHTDRPLVATPGDPDLGMARELVQEIRQATWGSRIVWLALQIQPSYSERVLPSRRPYIRNTSLSTSDSQHLTQQVFFLSIHPSVTVSLLDEKCQQFSTC